MFMTYRKYRKINHKIIFSESISAAFEAFSEKYLMFFSICLDKKNDEVIRSLGILKEIMSPRIKYIFAQERKVMFFAK